METPNIYLEKYISKVVELGYTIRQERDNTFRLNLNEVNSRDIKIRLIVSEPIERRHGSANNTEIKAIGYFKYKILPEDREPDFYVFSFNNKSDNRIEFVIIPFNELKNRLDLSDCVMQNLQETELILWLLPDDYLFEATQISIEGDWWFIAGRMAKNTHWDYTSFLNRWEVLQ